MDSKTRRQVNTWFAQHSTGRERIAEFVDGAVTAFPFLAEAFEGIYTGREGRMTSDPVDGKDACVVMTWYYSKVDCCYLS